MSNPNDEDWREWVRYPLLQSLLSGAANVAPHFVFTAKPDQAGHCPEAEAELAEMIGIDARAVPINILIEALKQMRALGKWASDGYVLMVRDGEPSDGQPDSNLRKLKAWYILGEEY